jgi:peroxiredoxin
MKAILRNLTILLVPGLLLGLAWPQQTVQEGSDAPVFELTGSDGETYALDTLREDAPVFVTFWKESCPSNVNAVPLFESITGSYSDKVTMLGVVSGPQERLGRWLERYSGSFTVLPDPDKALIGAYGLRRSIVTFQIGTDGKIAKIYPGYGREALTALNNDLAAVAGVAPAEVDLSSAPDRTAYG